MSPGVPAPAGVAAVAATGVERRFGRTAVLRGIDLECQQGETLALLGPNGAGKTTLLRILAQVLRPSAGEMRILGMNPARQAVEVRACLGFLGHETGLYADLTALENLRFTARLYALDRVDERAKEGLASVRLLPSEKVIRELSRGQQQRVALARVLLHEPKLLVLDEPWTGLDRDARRVLGERLDAHRKGGGATILTTHDLQTGYAVADRIVLLAGGRRFREATTDEFPFSELVELFESLVDGVRG